MSDQFMLFIKQDYPKSWVQYIEVAGEVLNASPATSALKPEELSFDISFGILLRFFKENELEFDYNNLKPVQYKEEIREIFSSFEGVIGHYS